MQNGLLQYTTVYVLHPITVYSVPLRSTPPHYGLLHLTTAIRIAQKASSMVKSCDESRPKGLFWLAERRIYWYIFAVGFYPKNDSALGMISTFGQLSLLEQFGGEDAL